jgi:CheY-like chemotaxis protein
MYWKDKNSGEPKHSFRGKTLLIVDDDRNICELLSIWLKDEFPGLNIVHTGSGEDGLNLICSGRNSRVRRKGIGGEKSRVDVIIMDVRLPGINGLEATRRIKIENPEIQVVILSQYNGTEYRKKAEEAGATTYILKRQSVRELLPVLRQALGKGVVG